MRPPRVLRRRRVVAVLASLLLAALCVLAFGGCAADHLVLGQSRETINPATLRRELVEYPHGTVECWVARSPGAASREPRAYVLFFVGKSDRAERWTAAVAGASGDRPVEAWGMNHPGSGGSTGPPRLARVAPAALATYDRMQHQASSAIPATELANCSSL